MLISKTLTAQPGHVSGEKIPASVMLALMILVNKIAPLNRELSPMQEVTQCSMVGLLGTTLLLIMTHLNIYNYCINR
mgnify:CR=1 FL=1